MLMILYLFGHYDKATEVANELVPQLNVVWGLRSTRLVYLCAALAITARLREDPKLKAQEDDLISIAEKYKARIVEWQSHCDVNYRMWSLLIDAEIFELQGRYHDAIQVYETSSAHAQLLDFNLDLALILESQAGFFIRRGGKRAAVATMRDAMSVYSRIGATGKVNQIATKHEFLFASLGSIGYQDAAAQTEDNPFDFGEEPYQLDREKERFHDDRTAIDRTKAWLSPSFDDPGAAKDSLPEDIGLDILDLTNILNFSHAISSELDIDKLLIKMMEIIISSTGSQSDVSHIVTRSEGGENWCVRVTGSASGTRSQSVNLADVEDDTQKQVILYTTRFKESVLVANITQDDRFHATEQARGVISLPIVQGKEILGVLFLVSL